MENKELILKVALRREENGTCLVKDFSYIFKQSGWLRLEAYGHSC